MLTIVRALRTIVFECDGTRRIPSDGSFWRLNHHRFANPNGEKDGKMATPDAVLYTRKGCHLCDEAFAELVRHGLEPKVIDIDDDPELTEQYTECVPVVWIGGRERFRGRVNAVLLERLLHST